MPIKLQVKEEKGVLVSIAQGELTSDDIFDHIEELLLNPAYKGMDLVCDARHADLITYEHTVDKMKTLLRDYREHLLGRRWALVVEGMLQGTAGWMFSQIAKPLKIEVKIFSEEQTALDWILQDREKS